MKPTLLLVAALLAGCATPALVATDAAAPLRFSVPVRLTSDGPGFEPSIEVAPDGTIYVAAAKTQRASPHLASWLWYSDDGGASWPALPSPLGVHQRMPGLEGDLGVDAKGRLYFVDTYVPDNSVHRWSAGPSWDFSRPLQGTTALLDDRPFVAAHGDGRVYVLSNAGAQPRIHVTRSLDGGLTWQPSHAFPTSHFCHVAASPADDVTVLVACAHGQGEGARVVAHLSTDAGATWRDEEVATYARGTGYLTPAAAFDGAGAPFVAWADERVEWSGVQDATWEGDAPGLVLVARRTDDGWAQIDATPFEGRFGMLAASGGRAGTLGLSFYATRDMDVNETTQWHAYALLTRDGGATWHLAELDPEPMSVGAYPPRDIHDNDFGPDGAMHVILQRNLPNAARTAGDGIHADVLHVRQLGPIVPLGDD